MSKKAPSLLTPNKFSKLIGRSRQAISQAIKTGLLPVIIEGGKKKINPVDPIVQEYAKKAKEGKQSGQNLAKNKKKVAEKGKKKSKKTTSVEDVETSLPEYLRKISDSEDISFEQFTALTKTEADKIKIYEQLKQIRIKTKKDKQELISRKLIKVLFGKLHEIDENEFKQLKSKIIPDISSIMGCVDPEKMIEAEKRVDEEIYKILKHVKHEIDRFIKKLGGEYE